MAKIFFQSEDLEVDADNGISLLELSREVECDITFGCQSGTCGTCRIRVLNGGENLSKMGPEEREFMEGFGAHATERLACQVIVNGDCVLQYVGLDDLPT